MENHETRKPLIQLRLLRSLFALAAIVLGCGDEKPTAGNELQTLDHDLALGASGSEVRALHEYLRRYGYFPNDELAQEYPRWRPIVPELPHDLGVYGEQTVAAVLQFQANAGIQPSGVVDGPTRALMKAHRCGVPDGMVPLSEDDKYAHHSRWSANGANWTLTNNDDVSFSDARNAIASAAATWASRTNFTFNFVSYNPGPFALCRSPAGCIFTHFAGIDGPGNTVGDASYPSFVDVRFDTGETWSVATPTPAGAQDLQTAALHELGHALGLEHSSKPNATMNPFVPTRDRDLDVDDIVGISVIYDSYKQLPGSAKDIGSNGLNAVWVIGTSPAFGGYLIYRWNGTTQNWEQSDGAAVRVAVDPNGFPYVVNSFGDLYRRTSTSATSGTWELLATGVAKDVGVGADGSVWIVRLDSQLARYFTTSRTFRVANNGLAERIAVGPTGVPWVVNSAGDVFRRTTNDWSTGDWEQLPRPSTANTRDVGIWFDNLAWAIGDSGGLYSWNEQSQATYDNGSIAAGSRRQWLQAATVAGGASTAVAVGFEGQPWFVQNNGIINTSTK